MVDVQVRGSACRIKRSAFDLLSIRDYLVDDHDDNNDEEEAWDFIGSMFRLKTTFMYCDFNQMISYAPKDQKESLTQLANKLFCSIEEVLLTLTLSLSLSHIRHGLT